MQRSRLLKLCFLCAIIFTAAVIFVTKNKWSFPVQATPSLVHTSSLQGKSFFDDAYGQAAFSKQMEPAAAIIVSHHLLVAPLIAATFETARAQNPKTVFIVGPDHLSRGKTSVTVSLTSWQTPYGYISPTEPVIKNLTTIKDVTLDEKPFDYEHSIASLVPFVKRSLPNAKIVPIILRADTSEETVRQIANALPIDKDSLFVSSVDFSHYLPSSIAAFHDATGVSVLRSATFLDLPKLEIDSIPSLQLLQLYVARRQAEKFNLLERTDGTKAANVPSTEGITSYVFARYTTGKPEHDDVITYAAQGSTKFPISPEDRLARGFDLSDKDADGIYTVRGATIALLTNPSIEKLKKMRNTVGVVIIRHPAGASGSVRVSRPNGDWAWPLPSGLVIGPNKAEGFDMRLNQGTLLNN